MVTMIRSLFTLALVAPVGLALLAGCTNDKKGGAGGASVATPTTQHESPEVAAAAAHADLVKRGGQLVRMGGCSDCHTPMAFDPKIGAPVPQMDRFLSGHPEGRTRSLRQPRQERSGRDRPHLHELPPSLRRARSRRYETAIREPG